MSIFRKKAKLAVVLYYGNDNYIGEDVIDLNNYSTIEMTEQSLTVLIALSLMIISSLVKAVKKLLFNSKHSAFSLIHVLLLISPRIHNKKLYLLCLFLKLLLNCQLLLILFLRMIVYPFLNLSILNRLSLVLSLTHLHHILSLFSSLSKLLHPRLILNLL